MVKSAQSSCDEKTIANKHEKSQHEEAVSQSCNQTAHPNAQKFLTEKPETHLVKSPDLTDRKSFESGPLAQSGPKSDPVVTNMDSISHAMTEKSKALTENLNNEEYGPEHSAYSK